ncbi:MAG: rhomboid family intramembrane serine protease [Acidobacteriota bacterium]|nr:MAG: rhomboid family intramembrane serine protease [Acidobacteriota bacterium]
MFERRKTGSVVCRSCGRLVGVTEESCYNCGAWNPGLWGFAPLLRRLGYDLGFVQIVTYGCVGLYLATLLYDPANIRMDGMMSILSPSTESLLVFGGSGTIPVFGFGRWWTVLSAAWLHGGALHILFNMMWIRQLAPVTATLYGVSRLIIIYTVASITGFVLSSVAGIPLTLGASAPLFGLFGALFWAGRRTGSSELGRQAMIYAVILLIFGFLWPNVDNYAHIGGFVGGLAAAYLLDPLKRETVGTMIIALVCLLVTALSVLVSIVTA